MNIHSAFDFTEGEVLENQTIVVKEDDGRAFYLEPARNGNMFSIRNNYNQDLFIGGKYHTQFFADGGDREPITLRRATNTDKNTFIFYTD